MFVLRARSLLLILVGAVAASAQVPQADPKARALLREAYERRYRWEAGFPGFSGKILVVHSGMERNGTVRVTAQGQVEVQLEGAEAQEAGTSAASWARQAVKSVVAPLFWVPFEEEDGKHPVTFGKPEQHPAGRSILLHDERSTRYRVREGQIWQIERDEILRGETPGRVTQEFLEFARTEEGRFLPRTLTLTRFAGGSGRLQQANVMADTYQRLSGYYVPYLRRETLAKDGGTETRWLRLTDLRLSSQ